MSRTKLKSTIPASASSGTFFLIPLP